MQAGLIVDLIRIIDDYYANDYPDIKLQRALRKKNKQIQRDKYRIRSACGLCKTKQEEFYPGQIYCWSCEMMLKGQRKAKELAEEYS